MPDNRPEQPSTRPAGEIQAAHDRLVSIIRGEVPNPFQNRHAMQMLMESAAVLCWVLNHDHNQTFGENLKRIDDFLRALGYQLVDSGKLQYPADEGAKS